METLDKVCAKKVYRKEARGNVKKSAKNNDVAFEDSSSRKLVANQVNSNLHSSSTFKPQVLKPRISKLENLEAKMASIEVSLSSYSSNVENQQQEIPNSQAQMIEQNATFHNLNYRQQSNAIYFSGNALKKNANCDEFINQPDLTSGNSTTNTTDICYLMGEIDKLRARLVEKDAIIGSLKEQSNQIISNSNQAINNTTRYVNLNCTWTNDVLTKENHTKEDRSTFLQRQIDNKSIIVKNLKLKLEGLEVKDLDSRIRQAELECLLEKEEMKILNLKQELMNIKPYTNNQKLNANSGNKLQPSLLNGDDSFLYSTVISGNCTSLVAIELTYDNSAPCFYVTKQHGRKGLIVQWAKENSKLKKGDILLEVNSITVINSSKNDFLEKLKSSTQVLLKIVVVRNLSTFPAKKTSLKDNDSLKEEMSSLVNKLDNKIKENRELQLSSQNLKKELTRLKLDNQRLHHRTFYLEDQINEILTSDSVANHSASGNACSGSDNFECNESAENSVIRSHRLENVIENVQNGPSVCHANSNGLSKVRLISRLIKHPVDHSNGIPSRCNTGSRHHVLQVKIPFSNSETKTSTSIRPYMNIPMSNRLLTEQNQEQKLTSMHGRYTGADSDSGNYSGDSMDDSQQNSAPRLMTGFVLQRQLSVHSQNIVTMKTSNNDESKITNHCYMNVPNRKKDTNTCNLKDINESNSLQSEQVISTNNLTNLALITPKNLGFIQVVTDNSKSENEEIEQWC